MQTNIESYIERLKDKDPNVMQAFVMTKMFDNKYLPSNFPKVRKSSRISSTEAEKYRSEAFSLDTPSITYLINKAKETLKLLQADLRVFLQLKHKKKIEIMTDYPDIVMKNLAVEIHNQGVIKKILEKTLKKRMGQKKANKLKVGRR